MRDWKLVEVEVEVDRDLEVEVEVEFEVELEVEFFRKEVFFRKVDAQTSSHSSLRFALIPTLKPERVNLNEAGFEN